MFITSQSQPGPRPSGVYACGFNQSAQFGFSTQNIGVLTRLDTVSASGSVVEIGGGTNHTLYLFNDGRIFSAGSNSDGRCGQSGTVDPVSLGYMVSDINNDTNPDNLQIFSSGLMVRAGDTHSFVVDTSGNVWACGGGANGRLGIGSTSNREWLVPSFMNGNVVDIAAGNSHSILCTSDGDVYTCGNNDSFKQGHVGGNTLSWRLLSENPGLRAIAVAAGLNNSYIVTTSGVWCAGLGTTGQLGDNNDTTNIFVRSLLPSGVDIIKIVAGDNFCVGLTPSGTVWSWGVGTDGRLGYSSSWTSVPTQIPDLENVVDIAVGIANGYALDSDGYIRSWGSSSNGALGRDGFSTPPAIMTSGSVFDYLHESRSGRNIYAYALSESDNSPSLFISGDPRSENQNLDLFIYGIDQHNESIDLITNGHDYIQANVDLFIEGVFKANSSITLAFPGNLEDDDIDIFIGGSDLRTNGINLFINGEPKSNDIDLFLLSSDTENADITLSITASIAFSGDISLFIRSEEKLISPCFISTVDGLIDSSDILFIRGHISDDAVFGRDHRISLFVINDGFPTTNDFAWRGWVQVESGFIIPSTNILTPVFVRCDNFVEKVFDLFITGHVDTPIGLHVDRNIDLFIQGLGDEQSAGFTPDHETHNMFVRVSPGGSAEFGLYLHNIMFNRELDFFIGGFLDTNENTIDLFIDGLGDLVDNSVDLNLILSASGVLNNGITTYIHGF